MRTAKHKHHKSNASAQHYVHSSTHSTGKQNTSSSSKEHTVDSGASISVTNNASLLETVDILNPGKFVQVANKQMVKVEAIGTVRLHMVDENGEPYTVLLKNVHYSPHFSSNLLSVRELYAQHKMSTTFKGSSAYFTTADNVRIPIALRRHQYKLHVFSLSNATPEIWHKRFMHAGSSALHRMGRYIPCLSHKHDFSQCRGCLMGGGHKLPFRRSVRSSPSIDRAERDGKRTVFKYFGQRIATDLCGPFETSIDGDKYAIVFHDSYSKYIVVYTIPDKTKETVLGAFKQFLSDHQDLLIHGVGTYWADNGGEFANSSMDAFCDEMCIKRAYSVPYCPPQNPYAERAWGTVLRPVRSAIAESGVDEKFWSFAIKQAAHVHNILCDGNGSTPYDVVHGQLFDYNKLHTMFSLCYYLLPERERESKLSPRSLPAIYLGPDPNRHGHLVYVPGLQRVTTGYHVVFNEGRYYNKSADGSRHVTFDEPGSSDGVPIGRTRRRYHEERDHYDPAMADTDTPPERQPDAPTDMQDYPGQSPAGDLRHGTTDMWNENHCENSRCLYPRGHDGPCSDQEVRQRFRPQPRRQYAECTTCDGCVFAEDHCGICEDSDAKPLNFPQSLVESITDSDSVLDFDPMETLRVHVDGVSSEVLSVNPSDLGDIPCPKTYSDTQSSPLKQRWADSMLKEYNALIGNNTWELVSRNDPRVKGRKPTKSRWVYTIKYNRDGTVDRFKSRFVVCGYSQRHGIDYDRAFSATLRATTFRTLLSIAAGKKMRLAQFDVSNAFTQADMDDVDVFVEPPLGFEVWERVNGKKVSKLLYLRRALYGTKQASRLWQDALRAFLVSPNVGFVNSTTDPCLYRLVDGDSEIILGVYVDDIIVAYRGDKLFDSFQQKFFKRFPGKQQKLSWFLGMGIDQHHDYSIHVDHSQSIEKMAAKFIPGNTTTRECPTPDAFAKLDRAQNDVDRAKISHHPYASLVGALLYISVMSRPDIAFHTSILAKFLADPSPECWDAAVILMQYLHSTRKKRLYYSGKVEVPDGLEKHRPDIERNHGFVAYSDSSWGNKYPYPMFGYSVTLFGSLVSFSSKQLKTVAFSSCEAEYAAASYACKEVEFVRNICADMGVTLHGRLVLAVDNTACIDIAHDVGVSGRTKHFDRAIHYLRDLTQLRKVIPVYVNTHQQRADGYTKALDKSTYTRWVSHLLHG